MIDEFVPGEPIEAHGCGAIGCHEREDLRRVVRGGRQRVLCPDHAHGFVEGNNE